MAERQDLKGWHFNEMLLRCESLLCILPVLPLGVRQCVPDVDQSWLLCGQRGPILKTETVVLSVS